MFATDIVQLEQHNFDKLRHLRADEELSINTTLAYPNCTTTRPRRTKVEGALFLNVVIRKRTPVFKLLASKDQALLVGWDTFLILNLRFHVVDGVGRLDFERDSLASESLHEDLHASTKTQDYVDREWV
jgi:hypothetical protein